MKEYSYVEVNLSSVLPGIKADSLVKFINRGLSESPSIIKKDFLLLDTVSKDNS
jgi:hypothetical protein